MEIKITVTVGEMEPIDVKVDVPEKSEEEQTPVFTLAFNELCTGWSSMLGSNIWFLKAQERYANELLRVRGHLFVNEVYDMLGAPRIRDGWRYGWVFDGNRIPDKVQFETFDTGDGNTRIILQNLDGDILKYL